LRPIEWKDGKVYLIDQTKLPLELTKIECGDYKQVAEAIKKLRVRGAPAIGVAAAFGIVLGIREYGDLGKEEFFAKLKEIAEVLRNTRPTAVNLFWAIQRMLDAAEDNREKDPKEIILTLTEEALQMAEEDVQTNKKMGEFGAQLIKEGDTILTHCNAGALATVDHGTALGVIREAHRQGKNISVFADETRPLLQGARLTTWELMQDGIPVTLITDNMAGHFMKSGKINLVIVGADRIAANGDVANKIGTYGVAVLAKENNIPFYVAAPVSTFDLKLQSGEDIPIEERNPEEVTHLYSSRIAPEGVKVANPAFDVTPNKYVAGIITEKGIITAPYEENIRKILG
jgi:methylthioribose-1-phosphate isomerase